MRKPSARCQPHTVLLRKHIWKTDQDGGREIASSSDARGVPCFVQVGVSRLMIEESDAGGTRRVTEATPTKVYFVDDPSLNAEDLIYWVESQGRTHWYKVLSTEPHGGLSNLWIAEVTENR